MIRVFVYGSLMSGLSNHIYMKRAGGVFIAEDTINATLHAYCPYFPAVTISDDEVKGEVYEIPNSGLKVLDRLEGEGVLYKRVTLTTLKGEEVEVYVMEEEDCADAKMIVSGDWRAYFAENPPTARRR